MFAILFIALNYYLMKNNSLYIYVCKHTSFYEHIGWLKDSVLCILLWRHNNSMCMMQFCKCMIFFSFSNVNISNKQQCKNGYRDINSVHIHINFVYFLNILDISNTFLVCHCKNNRKNKSIPSLFFLRSLFKQSLKIANSL